MKRLLYIILFISIVSCQFQEPKKLDSNSKKDLSTIEGVWGLTSYMDSIVVNKQLAKYRSQFPAWFGILIEIKGDTITSYGSLKNIKTELANNQDTLFKFTNTESGKWMLLKGKRNLILKQFPNQEETDSNTYFYRQRQDLNFMTINQAKRGNKIQKHITNYFNKQILSGKYRDSKTKKVVHFLKDGRLEGLRSYTNYNIGSYFGTYHPFKNKDVVILKKKEQKTEDYFNWKFEDDMVVLTEFKREEVQINGKKMKTEYPDVVSLYNELIIKHLHDVDV